MRQLPLWSRVVFVDWHGVLSRDPFWMSIRRSATHPLRAQLEANLNDVFSHDNEVGHGWMRGLLSSEQVIAAMNIQLPKRFREDFLARRLEIDCAHMSVNVALFEVLRRVAASATIVLATDNTDSFARTFDRERQRKHRITQTSETLANWAIICDDIICSSDVQTLKSEEPSRFFGSWIAAHNLSFRDAVLIDDRADNCEAFERHGGTALQWKMGKDDIQDIAKSLDYWLETTVG